MKPARPLFCNHQSSVPVIIQPTGGGRIGNALNARRNSTANKVGPADTTGATV